MADVKDILGVPRAAGPKQEAKKEKEKVQRPAGMSREAFALLDGSHPIVPSLAGDLRKKGDLQGLKEKRKTQRGAVRPSNCTLPGTSSNLPTHFVVQTLSRTDSWE